PPLLRPIACAYPPSPMTGHAVEAPMQGTIVSVDVSPGDTVIPGQQLVVIESMKMEHVIAADDAGEVEEIAVAAGDTVNPGDVMIRLSPSRSGDAQGPYSPPERHQNEQERADLAEVVDRHSMTLDERRPDAVGKRRGTGQRTAREDVDDLIDPR